MTTRKGTKEKPSVPVKPKYPQVIRFGKATRRMFQEILTRQVRERNQALKDVYEDMGILQRIQMQEQTGEMFEILPGYVGVKVTLRNEDDGENGTKETKRTDKRT